ncbi:MAG: PilT/PilU family type 4a pilus ATPase [Verrucomicrobiota bacterium]|nr:PilT/PilU family type 4a pilus ATPase [Verrucomicrobiota bacterium]
MKEEVCILACICLEHGMLNPESCRELAAKLDPEIDLVGFAEKLLDDGIAADAEELQALVDIACDKLQAGEKPPFDPFFRKKAGLSLSMKSSQGGSVASPPPPPPSPTDHSPTPSRPAPPAEAAPAPTAPPLSLRTNKPAAAAGTGSFQDSVADLLAAFDKPAAPKASPAAPVSISSAVSENAPVSSSPTPAVQSVTAPAPVTPATEPNPAKQKGAAHGSHEGGHGGKEMPAQEIVKVRGQPALPAFDRLASMSDTELRETMAGLMRHATASGMSDLHISAAARPFARKNRVINYLAQQPVDAETARRMNLALLSPEQKSYFLENCDYDFSMAFDTGERYRVNLMITKDGFAGTYRTIASKIPTLEELGFVEAQSTVIKKLLAYHNGLILVTGPVGSGKTTTLAAMIREINHSRDDHIITVEEPIEIIHRSEHCSVTQRGVGPHTRTFHSALKGALRQDPDIIVIGEMRDLETIEMAISASETGHLVIGTMHTSDAGNTLNRLLDVFPPAQQTQIRAMVAESLRGIICQRLLPNKKGGLVLAVELLIRNLAVGSLIREGKSEGLGNIMETGKRQGMIRMDASVLDLWREGKISDEVALANIQNKSLASEIAPPVNRAPVQPEPAQAKKRGLFG